MDMGIGNPSATWIMVNNGGSAKEYTRGVGVGRIMFLGYQNTKKIRKIIYLENLMSMVYLIGVCRHDDIQHSLIKWIDRGWTVV